MVRLFYVPEISEDFKRKLREYFSMRQQTLLLALFVGLLAGFFGFAFKISINLLAAGINSFALHPANWWEWTYYPLIGFVGGSIAGYCVQLVPEASGSGIPEVRLALFRAGQEVKRRNIFAKFIGGVAGIGTGLSMGREGPTVQIGASCGTFVSKLFGITGKRQKAFLAAGAGAGLAAAFNTPIAGVLFVVEELSHNFSAKFLAPCIVASVTASAVIRHMSGNKLSYEVNIVPFEFTVAHVPIYIILGLLAGLLGTVFIKSILSSLDYFARLDKVPKWIQVGIAGFLTGITALFLPEVIGDGHEPIEMLLNGKVLLVMIPLWFFGKLLLTSLAYGSGAPGGLFAPALMCGASMGLLLGKLIQMYFPALGINPEVVALVGMGAFFTAVVRTPIAAAVIMFEMTGNYHTILPLMLSCIIADLVSARMFPRAIYPALLFRSTGIDLDEEAIGSPLEQFKVRDVMTSQVESLSKTTTLAEAFETLERSHHNGFPVISDEGNLIGIITLADLENAFLRKIPLETKISEIMSKHIITVTPDNKLDYALHKLHDNKIGRLIVVDPANNKKLAGILTRSDILKAEI
ncbi:MAG: chloride channel protein [Cyanobacteriota bacterium]